MKNFCKSKYHTLCPAWTTLFVILYTWKGISTFLEGVFIIVLLEMFFELFRKDLARVVFYFTEKPGWRIYNLLLVLIDFLVLTPFALEFPWMERLSFVPGPHQCEISDHLFTSTYFNNP